MASSPRLAVLDQNVAIVEGNVGGIDEWAGGRLGCTEGEVSGLGGGRTERRRGGRRARLTQSGERRVEMLHPRV